MTITPKTPKKTKRHETNITKDSPLFRHMTDLIIKMSSIKETIPETETVKDTSVHIDCSKTIGEDSKYAPLPVVDEKSTKYLSNLKKIINDKYFNYTMKMPCVFDIEDETKINPIFENYYKFMNKRMKIYKYLNELIYYFKYVKKYSIKILLTSSELIKLRIFFNQ